MATEKQPVLIIGGGFCGLSAAYQLAQKGHACHVLEADKELGGLAGTFEIVPGSRIEKFYHHWFTSDTDVLNLARELGLGDKIRSIPSNTGLYFANSIFRLSSPWDLLTFKPIPLIDRIRTGVMALYARRIDDWLPLESELATDWIARIGGRKAFEVMWDPLLKGKFGSEAGNVSAVWFWNKLKLRGSSRNEKGGEELMYMEGGFESLTRALKAHLESRSVKIETGTEVTEILSERGRAAGVRTRDGRTIKAETVLATVPLPLFLELAKTAQLPAEYIERAAKIRFLGNVCLILRLKKSLSSTYWLNVADPTFPFVGVIEHTNFDSKENFGGEHIAYISKYLPTSDWLFSASNEEAFKYALPFIKKIFPEFSQDWVIGYSTWRAHYSQPVVTKHYSKMIPEEKTPIEGLWLSTMAQIYPEDRGTNYAVRFGRRIGDRIAESLKDRRG